jgi:hypothetical protein
VIIIIIIIVLGFVAYSKFQEVKLNEQKAAVKSAKIVSLAQQLMSWPELECSVAERKEFNCIDSIKLGLLTNFINNSISSSDYAFRYYHDLLGKSKILIYEVYPSMALGTERQVLLYDNVGTGKSREAVLVPLNIYDPAKKSYVLGVMELWVYE